MVSHLGGLAILIVMGGISGGGRSGPPFSWIFKIVFETNCLSSCNGQPTQGFMCCGYGVVLRSTKICLVLLSEFSASTPVSFLILGKLQPLSSFVETPRSPLNAEVSSCGQIFSLATLTRGKGENVSKIVTKVIVPYSPA